MARDMGLQCWGVPGLEILHFDDRATPIETIDLEAVSEDRDDPAAAREPDRKAP